MSISPFAARPPSQEGERRRRKLAPLVALVGIAATLLAYAVSPGVRHAVGHAERSVRHAVGHVFDRDKDKGKGQPRRATPTTPTATPTTRGANPATRTATSPARRTRTGP